MYAPPLQLFYLRLPLFPPSFSLEDNKVTQVQALILALRDDEDYYKKLAQAVLGDQEADAQSIAKHVRALSDNTAALRVIESILSTSSAFPGIHFVLRAGPPLQPPVSSLPLCYPPASTMYDNIDIRDLYMSKFVSKSMSEGSQKTDNTKFIIRAAIKSLTTQNQV